jgi:hypothetical protein
MKIAVNFYGQPRDPQNALKTFNNAIVNSKDKFKVLYTTWDDERIDKFEELFPHSFIRQVSRPDVNYFDDYNERFRVDATNPNKTLYGYLLSLYCKKESAKTIELFEEISNTEFDLLITLRTDTILDSNVIQEFYDAASQKTNTAFVTSEINHDVYQKGAYPDMFLMTSRKSINSLRQIEILEKCVVPGTNFFHPETSAYQCLIANNLSVEYMQMTARVIGCSRTWFKNDQGIYEIR